MITQRIARELLGRQGIAVIWRLHEDAATLYLIGNRIGADSLVEIAEAAEREWLSRRLADFPGYPSR